MDANPKRPASRRARYAQNPATIAGAPNRRVEQADILAGLGGVGAGVVTLVRHAPTRVEFSIVNGRAILEGDIELGTPRELRANESALAAIAGEMQAAVVSDTSNRWPRGRVPYEPVPATSPILGIVTGAIEEITRRTSVRFATRQSTDVDFVAFEVSAFCSSRVGRAGGRQVIRLSSTASVGNAIHELCHALGLWHEQSREDRDSYIRVLWENILPGYEHNFRQQISDGDDVGPYDFGSIMHYPPDAFSRDGLPTLEALSGNPTFGQRNHLSDLDIAALHYLYPPTADPSTASSASSASDSSATLVPPATAIAATSGGAVVSGIGDGVQFRVTIPAQQVARVVTNGWRVELVLHWDVVCIDGPVDAGPLLRWSYAPGRSANNLLDYYFTIINLSNQPVTAEARYFVER